VRGRVVLALVVFLAFASGCHRHGPEGDAPIASASAPDRAAPQAPEVSSAASTTPEAPLPPAGSAELALVAPLRDGSTFGGFTVRAVHGVHGGVFRIVCAKDKALVRLDIALLDESEGAASPPATAGRYAIYYSVRGGATPEDGEQLATRLARVLRANASAAVPPGLTPFKPNPKPGISL
jgi:hypothetical protein